MTRLSSIAIVALGSGLMMALSWRSFRHRRSHGFFRFFAFEAILCLVALNVPHWFRQARAPMQLVSWALLAISLFLAIHAFQLLRRLGKPTAPAADAAIHRFENTTTLVTVGAYRYIRHPLYASLLCGTWGAVLKATSLASIVLGLIATAFLVATAKAEEAENLARFGSAYRDYMNRTRLFIPFVW